MLSALDPTRKAGGGGAVRFRPDTKSGWGGGAVRFRPDTKRGGGGGEGVLSALDPTLTKSGGGGGGGGGVLSSASGAIQKAGKGEGCLAEEGALPYMKGGPQPPPPPWIRLCEVIFHPPPPFPPLSLHV